MRKIGGHVRRVGGHVSTAGGLVKAVANTEKIGGGCLQIFAGSPRVWARKLYSPAEAEQFNRLVNERDLRPVFIHALYLINLASDNQELVEKSYRSLVIDLKNGRLIGAGGVVVHIGSHQGRGFATVAHQVVDRIKRLLEETEETPLLIENTACSHGKIGTLEEVAEVLAAVDNRRLGVCLDSAHLFEAGWDIKDKVIVNALLKNLRKLGILERVSCLHLNDSKTKLNSRHDVHANLGEGEIGLEGLRNLVERPELAGLPVILEVPGVDKQGPDRANIELATRLFGGVK